MFSTTRVALFGACVAFCAVQARAATDGGESPRISKSTPSDADVHFENTTPRWIQRASAPLEHEPSHQPLFRCVQ